MTQATDRDIAEIKDLIAVNTRSIDSLARITENIARVTEANTKEIETLVVGMEANTKAITDLDKKIEVGFTKIEGQINTVEAKLEGKIDKLDERTKLGFWGFIFRGTALAALAALTAIFVKYLFPILPTELPKL
jgi:hypothetical protein